MMPKIAQVASSSETRVNHWRVLQGVHWGPRPFPLDFQLEDHLSPAWFRTHLGDRRQQTGDILHLNWEMNQL
jgi:hypothetical protein